MISSTTFGGLDVHWIAAASHHRDLEAAYRHTDVTFVVTMLENLHPFNELLPHYVFSSLQVEVV